MKESICKPVRYMIIKDGKFDIDNNISSIRNLYDRLS